MVVGLTDTRQHLYNLSKLLAGGRQDVCEFGHPHHDMMKVNVDAPCQRLEIFNWFKYETPEPGYCTGKDEVSKGLQHCGSWEREESNLVMDILSQTHTDRDIVLDFGSHVGWYTMLASYHDYEVLAVDACAEHLKLVHVNAHLPVTCLAWIDENSPVIPVGDYNVRFLKVDVEGAEPHVIRICGELFKANRIESVLLEVTPPNLPACGDDIRGGNLEAVEMLTSFGFTGQPVGDTSGQHNVFFTR